jgi:hypothetical protein
MAIAAIDALKLGRGESTDFLGVSFSAVDGVGHLFGPRSHEIQDALFRLDKTIGRLLDHLDTAVGSGNYVLGLSADHGVAEIPEQSGTGRVVNRAVTDALEKILTPALGDGTHVVSAAYTDVYLTDAARARLAKDERLRNAAFEALQAVPGVTSSSRRRRTGSCRPRSRRTARSTGTTSACRSSCWARPFAPANTPTTRRRRISCRRWPRSPTYRSARLTVECLLRR